jgi:hypothetical protein
MKRKKTDHLPIQPGMRGQAVIVQVARPARLGGRYTVQEVIEPDTGLCRVKFDNEVGRTHLTIVDPAFADPNLAERLVDYINGSAAAYVQSGFGAAGAGATATDTNGATQPSGAAPSFARFMAPLLGHALVRNPDKEFIRVLAEYMEYKGYRNETNLGPSLVGAKAIAKAWNRLRRTVYGWVQEGRWPFYHDPSGAICIRTGILDCWVFGQEIAHMRGLTVIGAGSRSRPTPDNDGSEKIAERKPEPPTPTPEVDEAPPEQLTESPPLQPEQTPPDVEKPLQEKDRDGECE